MRSATPDRLDPLSAPIEDETIDESRPASRRPMLSRWTTASTTWIFLILVTIVVSFAVVRFEQFATATNLRNIALDAAILLILAVGATYVVITAGVDLSVGSVLVFSSVIAAKVLETSPDGGTAIIVVAFVASLIAGTAWGMLNGVLVAKLQVPALIATLGTLGMALGFALILTKGTDIASVPIGLVETVGTGNLVGSVPYLVVVAIVIAAVGGVVLAKTRFGLHTYAIGSNPEAARRAGIGIDRHLIKVYGLAGLLAGVAGFLYLARFATTSVSGHSTDNLQVIAGVVIGGVSLFGGVGTMVGTVIGILIPAVLQNGFVIVGVQPFWQQVTVGAILILAVYLDQLRRRTTLRA